MKLVSVIVLLATFLVNLLFTRFLWNNSLVKHITILRPTTTLLETLLLALSLTILTAPSNFGGFAEGLVKGVKNAL